MFQVPTNIRELAAQIENDLETPQADFDFFGAVSEIKEFCISLLDEIFFESPDLLKHFGAEDPGAVLVEDVARFVFGLKISEQL